MRLATIATPDGLRLHVRGRSGDVDVAEATGDPRFASLHHVLEAGLPAMDAVRALTGADGREVTDADFGLASPASPRILCLGLNYSEHALEGGREVPTWPDAFVRGADSVLGPYADLVKPALTEKFDYEAELGIVIGAGGRYITADKALDAIAGYVVLNDASARDWQRAASQWTAGKNFEGSMPLGPEVVTADELDVSDLAISSTLNGQVMQSARTSRRSLSAQRGRAVLLVHPADARPRHRHRHAGRRRLRPHATGSGCIPGMSSRSPSKDSAPSATAWWPRKARRRTGAGARAHRSRPVSEPSLHPGTEGDNEVHDPQARGRCHREP